MVICTVERNKSGKDKEGRRGWEKACSFKYSSQRYLVTGTQVTKTKYFSCVTQCGP